MNKPACVSLFSVFICLSSTSVFAHIPHVCPEGYPDEPGLSRHIEEADIDDGTIGFLELFEHGKEVFTATFNVCDGQGRPATTGCGAPREATQPHMTRVSGPDSTSCAVCHFQPRLGGAGDFVANVFFAANCADPVVTSIEAQFGAERNSLGMFGAGPMEQLAKQMTAELQTAARPLTTDGWHEVSAMGVTFQVLIENNAVVDSIGVDTDLVVKPFEQIGRIANIRTFSANAFNQHHGMQAEELFPGDQDRDGVSRELTDGDIIAVTVFQAALGTPTQVLPTDSLERGAVQRGERTFATVGCADCHVPSYRLDSSIFDDGEFTFDLTTTGEAPRPLSTPNGGMVIEPYTDLKIHNLCDSETDPDPIRTFCNDDPSVPQDPRRDQFNHEFELRPGSEFFVTRKLWDVGNSAPYGHRGDLLTITDAILAHGGAARISRDQFVALDFGSQQDVVKFLKTLKAPEQEGEILVP